MTDKTCNRCSVKGLWWNKKHYDKTGKWQLIDHKNKKGEWCVRNNEKKSQHTPIKQTIKLCEYCKDSNFGLCRSEKDYNTHIKAYHPNKEILTNLDYTYKHSGEFSVTVLRNWSSDPHFKKHWDRLIKKGLVQ
jgi:hypothetical protein